MIVPPRYLGKQLVLGFAFSSSGWACHRCRCRVRCHATPVPAPTVEWRQGCEAAGNGVKHPLIFIVQPTGFAAHAVSHVRAIRSAGHSAVRFFKHSAVAHFDELQHKGFA